MYSAYPFKYTPQSPYHPTTENNIHPTYTQSSYRHYRGNSYDANKAPNQFQNYNTPTRPTILQKAPKDEFNGFLSDTKFMPKSRYEETIKMSPQTHFPNHQLVNEINDYMENKKNLDQLKMKPGAFSYTNKINSANMIKMNIDISPKPKLTQMKAPVESYNNPKNQNLKHLIESQKLNKDKEEEDYSSFKKNNKNINLDLRATANFGILEPNKIKQFESENEQKLEASNRFLEGPQHKRVASSGFESFKHQENIDRQLLADNKLYFDESPSFKQQNKDYFDPSAIRYSYRTKKGFSQNNPYKVNQDNFITYSFMLKQSLYHLFAVCDGHGTLGHLVSYFIKQEFPSMLRVNPFLDSNPERAIYNSIKLLETSLEKSSINLNLSGSTFILVLFKDNKIYCANVGDSRAILSHRTPSFFSKWENIPLSIDHKPELPKEAERIIKAGGRISAIQDCTGKMRGPKRVWRLKEDTPGLAMSRSMGDLIAKAVGVTWEPEIKENTIDGKHKFIVIGSDGLWEFLGNEECTNIVGLFFLKNDLEGACEYLLKEACQRWIKNEENAIDDITFIIIFLEN